MKNKVKLRDNFELLLKRLEKQYTRANSNIKFYNEFKKILGAITIIIAVVGLWPLSIVTIVLSCFCAYLEKKNYHKCCDLVDKLETKGYELSELKDEIDQEKNKEEVYEEQTTLVDSSTLSKEGVKDDNKIYRKQ